jgi:DNA polymerase-1
MNVLIDLDPAIYRAGFASEVTKYRVVVENDAGEVEEEWFSPSDKKSAAEYADEYIRDAEQLALTVLDRERIAEPEPFSHAATALDYQINSIIFEVSKHYQIKSTANQLFLSTGRSFRDAVATIRPYKGNRDKLHKPVHYAELRKYAMEQHGAVMVDGIEADDAVSIAAHKMLKEGKPYVVVSIDKDLDQIPGKHYDYLKKINYIQSKEAATAFFWQQALSGDATDNIPGCPGIGAAKAAKLVASKTDSAIWDAIVAAYTAGLSHPKCGYIDPVAAAIETARLVYLLQKEDETWNPPKL